MVVEMTPIKINDWINLLVSGFFWVVISYVKATSEHKQKLKMIIIKLLIMLGSLLFDFNNSNIICVLKKL
jgi:hypothetical protein